MPARRRAITRVSRRRRRGGSYRNKWLQYNVLRAKLEWYCQIKFPQEAGQPVLAWGAGENDYAPYRTINNIMYATSAGNRLRDMFAYGSISGIKLEIMPHSNHHSTGISYQYPVVVAYLPGVYENQAGATFNEIAALNTSLMLDPLNRQSRYFSSRGASFDLKITQPDNSLLNGQLIVRALVNGTVSVSPAWNMKVTLYAYFRYAKVV